MTQRRSDAENAGQIVRRTGASTTRTVTTSATLSGVTLPAGRLLRRAEAARSLQVSVSTLRRLDSQLQPVTDDRGIHLYDPAKLEEARATIRQTVTTRTTDPHGVDGDLAAGVFDVFEEGRGPIDAVRELRVHPDAAERLYAQWARMRGSAVIAHAVLDDVREAMLEHVAVTAPIRTGQTLLDAVRRLGDVLDLRNEQRDKLLARLKASADGV